MHRFFLPAADWNTPTPTLDSAESHHALDVLRLNPGDRLTVFDGQGGEAPATLTETTGKLARLKIGPRAQAPALPCAITLAQAVPKGKNMDFIIQKAVELGASAIVPLLSDRTVVQLDPAEAEKKRQKWRDTALEACKQCGQNRLPDIATPRPVKSFLENGPRFDLMLIASLQPDARPIKSVLADTARPRSVCVFVGPEGDFTPAELALAKSHGSRPVTLGPIILRTETAALYCLSVLAHELFPHGDGGAAA
jgi:16S rRNA (uracil1498-N3)-methyltransferase